MPDVNFLVQHIQKQFASLLDNPSAASQSRRWFHGRGKAYEGWDWCCIDYFSPVLIVIFYREPEPGIESSLMEGLIDCIQQFNASLTEMGGAGPGQLSLIQSLSVQRRYLHGSPFESLWGEVPETLYASRGDLRFRLSFNSQNVGYFLDIEQARVWLEKTINNISTSEPAQQSESNAGIKVLNLFAYTCAFSVVAKAAGAQTVVNIDLSRKSLSIGRENHQLSKVPSENVHYFAHDIFKSWGKLKKYGPYDLVIIDPPSFQKGSFVAAKDYARIATKMQALVAPHGRFLACLNAPEVLLSDFKSEIETLCPEFTCEEVLPENPDFPEAQEGRALKLLVFKRER